MRVLDAEFVKGFMRMADGTRETEETFPIASRQRKLSP